MTIKVKNGNALATSSKGSYGCDPLLQVVLFKFGKKETTGEIPCLEIPIIYEVKVCKRLPIWLLAHGLPIWPFARGCLPGLLPAISTRPFSPLVAFLVFVL